MGSVAIIGAGAAGLVTAKSMLEAGLSPTVFDKNARIGGIWDPASGPCWDTLRTNLTKYTCSFSDKPWDPALPLYPTREHVYAYLTSYAEPFLADVDLQLQTEVTKVEQADRGKWRVMWRGFGSDSYSGSAAERVFDFLVVAPGVQGAPKIPDLPGRDAFQGQVLHSAEYKTAAPFAGKRVVTVGPNHSGTDIAADVARVSDRVVHVSHVPIWVVPRYIPADPAAPVSQFHPLDFAFFSRTGAGPKKEETIRTPEFTAFVNTSCAAICGWPDGLVPKSLINDVHTPPTVAISEQYTAFLASGRLSMRAGRVAGLTESGVVLADGTSIDHVDVVIFGTGYDVPLHFLSAPVRETLAFDPDDHFKPHLAHRTTFHPDLPNFAVIGIIRGALFGIMEAQARWAAAVFSGRADLPPKEDMLEGVEVDRQIREQQPRPQLPHADYVGIMDDMYGYIGVQPEAQALDAGTFILPAHFRPGTMIGQQISEDVKLTKQGLTSSKYKGVTIRVFFSLVGRWEFSRTVEGNHNGTGGPLLATKGLAEFDAAQSPAAYHYCELRNTMGNGAAHIVDEHVVYRLDEGQGRVEVCLIQEGAEQQLYALEFLAPQPRDKTWKARGQHSAADGTGQQELDYEFQFQGSFMSAFSIKRTDHSTADGAEYVSTTSYKRPLPIRNECSVDN